MLHVNAGLSKTFWKSLVVLNNPDPPSTALKLQYTHRINIIDSPIATPTARGCFEPR
jgi:hypothetical protein